MKYIVPENVFPKYKTLIQSFLNVYKLDSITKNLDSKPYLKPKHKRGCRFCGNKYPDVLFKKTAHVIPELIGNKNLVGDFECDNCNAFFGKIENDLSSFLGLARTLSSVAGKNGIPTYKTPDKTLKIEHINRQDKDVTIKLNLPHDNIKINPLTKKLTFETVKNSYTPFNVYKCFLKMAFSLIKEIELKNYPGYKKLLFHKEEDNVDNSPYFRMLLISHPSFKYVKPEILHFKKKVKKSKLLYPSDVFVVKFQNYICQFYLPFNLKDKHFYQKKLEFQQLAFPPNITEQEVETLGEIRFEYLNLASTKMKKDEKESWTVNYNAVWKE